MPAGEYPFIQIAVHPAVRDRFAAGEALAVLSTDLGFVYWSNGSAARQFGYDTIYAFLEDEDFADTVTARQIATAAAQLSPARPRQSLVLRLGSGFRRFAAACTLERIALPDGEDALLLAMPADRKLKDGLARAEALVDGFGETETHVAVVDGEANTLAQSMTFAAIGLDPAVLEAMIADVDREEGRLVKRAVPTARGTWPAAIARLSHALYLVFVVEPAEAMSETTAPTMTPDRPAEPRPEAVSETPLPPQPAFAENTVPAENAPAPLEPKAKPDFIFDPAGRPVRFVWKIDAQGRFSELSPEFSDAVGPYAADAIGRTFEDLSQVFNLDRDGVIADLLRRRDTWSGKTVLWPVQGEALSVPVDLAALPTYSRDRVFDGFRGFGIVRIADAAADPEKIGLALVPEPVDFAETAGVADVPLPESPAAAPTVPEAADEMPVSAPPPQETVAPAAERPTVPPTPANSDAGPSAVGNVAGGPSNDSTTDDPFRGEVPALRLVPTPARRGTDARNSDKVIDLSEHRRGGREGLSKSDQAVFREIGQELGRKLADGAPAGPDAGTGPVAAEEAAAAPSPDAEPIAAVMLTRAEPAKPATTPIPEAEPVSAVALVPAVAPPRDTVATQDGTSDNDADLADDDAATEIVPGRAQLTRTLVDHLPLPLLIHRGDSLLHANDDFLALAGYASLAELDAAGGIGALFEQAGDVTLKTDARPDVLPLITASGAAVPVTARLQSVGWERGHALMLALSPQAAPASPQSAEDDAAAHSASLSVAMVEVQELRSILETATDGVVILDEVGAIRSMNRSASALFDYDDAETRGKPFAMLFAHESQRAVIDYVTGLSDNGVASVLNDGREVIGREASGGFIPLFMTIGRLTGSNGYCAVIRDITHWKRTEEELRNAKRAAETASGHKSDFLARVSHEIRTPLNAIIGFAEMMATERFGPLGSPRYQEYAHDIGRSGRHVLDIVNDLLDISKIEAGQQEMDFTAVSLNEALAETVSLLQPQANGQRVIIRTSLSTTLPDVVADLRSIKQIAINLLSNAIRFTPAGGQIVVSTAYEASGRVIVRVRDTGTGMSRTELDQAMKPFKQANSGAARPRGDGTGLGLPLTKAMVEANRAQFSIESAPGEGTLVQIAFPSQRVLAD